MYVSVYTQSCSVRSNRSLISIQIVDVKLPELKRDARRHTRDIDSFKDTRGKPNIVEEMTISILFHFLNAPRDTAHDSTRRISCRFHSHIFDKNYTG